MGQLFLPFHTPKEVQKQKTDEILKAIKRKGIAITEEQLERAFRVFEKESEVGWIKKELFL